MAGPTILDQCKVQLATERIGGSVFTANNIQVRLIVGGTTFDHTDTNASLHAYVPSFTGYAYQPVASWGTPVLDANFKAISLGSVVTFTNTGSTPSGSITHWWYNDASRGQAVLVGEFATPVVIPAGQSFSFTPTFSVTGENLTT